MTLLIFEIIFPLFLLILCAVQSHFLMISIKIPLSAAEKGHPVTIQILAENRFFLPVSRLKVIAEIRNSFIKGKGKQCMKGTVPLRGTQEFTFSLESGACGNLHIAIKKVKIYDMIGLFSIVRKVKDIAADLTIYPSVYPSFITISEHTANYPLDSDIYDSLKGGSDPSEVFAVREYQEGDRMQAVHWKLSSKKEDSLMVKEYSHPLGYPVVFLLCPPENPGTFSLETFFHTFLSLSHSMIDCGCKHYIACFHEETQDIERYSVETEEDLYHFLFLYSKNPPVPSRADLKLLYQEKYKGETFCTLLKLDETLALFKNDTLVTNFHKETLENELKSLSLSI